MSNKKSVIWSLALPLSIVLLAAVYYIKMPGVRKWVDAQTPVVHNILGKWIIQEPVKVVVTQGEKDPTSVEPSPTGEDPSMKEVSQTPPAPTGSSAIAPVVPVNPATTTVATPTFDFEKIAADRARWPKKVVLTKPTTFPAVLNSKVVGSIVAPAGTVANLVAMKGDKLGLEFNGGGAWLSVEQTDFVSRVQAMH